MRIEDHRLKPGWYKPSPNIGGPLIKPTLLVMHYTASGSDPSPTKVADYFLRPEAKASAHVVLGRDGTCKQVVPFDRKAWHAGKSIWRGHANCNDFSIGIEIDNWGRLSRTADGQVRSWTQAPIEAASATQLTHKHEQTPSLWEVYRETQLAALTDLTRAILTAYPSITEIVGHDDIAPGRKSDPGPAFPMARFMSLVEGRDDAPALHRTVIVESLNARSGPGRDYAAFGTFTKGADVKVLYDAPGDWALVEGTISEGRAVTAWVWDQYLR